MNLTVDHCSAIRQRLFDYALTSSGIIWICDEAGDTICLSPGWTQFTGQSAEDGFGMGWVNMVHPEDRQAALDTYLAAVHTRAPYQVRFRLHTVQQGYVNAIDSGHPYFDDGGEFLGYMGSALILDSLPSTGKKLRPITQGESEVLRAIVHWAEGDAPLSTLISTRTPDHPASDAPSLQQ